MTLGAWRDAQWFKARDRCEFSPQTHARWLKATSNSNPLLASRASVHMTQAHAYMYPCVGSCVYKLPICRGQRRAPCPAVSLTCACQCGCTGILRREVGLRWHPPHCPHLLRCGLSPPWGSLARLGLQACPTLSRLDPHFRVKLLVVLVVWGLNDRAIIWPHTSV